MAGEWDRKACARLVHRRILPFEIGFDWARWELARGHPHAALADRVAGARPRVAAVEDHRHMGVVGRELMEEQGKLLVGEVEGFVRQAAVDADQPLVAVVEVEGVELRCRRRAGAVAAIVEHGDLAGLRLAQVGAELADDVGPRRLPVLQHDDRRVGEAGPQIVGGILDIVDAALQPADVAAIFVDPDQQRVESRHPTAPAGHTAGRMMKLSGARSRSLCLRNDTVDRRSHGAPQATELGTQIIGQFRFGRPH